MTERKLFKMSDEERQAKLEEINRVEGEIVEEEAKLACLKEDCKAVRQTIGDLRDRQRTLHLDLEGYDLDDPLEAPSRRVAGE